MAKGLTLILGQRGPEPTMTGNPTCIQMKTCTQSHAHICLQGPTGVSRGGGTSKAELFSHILNIAQFISSPGTITYFRLEEVWIVKGGKGREVTHIDI